MSFYPARLVLAGISVETTEQSAVDPTAVLLLDQVTPTERHTPTADESWRGSAATSFGHQEGPLDAAITLSGPVFAEQIGWPLAGALGADAVTGTAAPYTHDVSLLNTDTQQPATYTLTTADPVGALAYAGCRFAECTLTASPSGLLSWSGSVAGLSGAAADTPSLTLPDTAPLAGWKGTVSIAGTDAPALAASVSIKRTLTAKRNTDGTRAPYTQRSGPATVTGSATLLLASDTLRGDYTAATDLAIVLAYSRGDDSLTLTSSSCTLTQADRVYGADWIELQIAWTADANSTDAGASGGLAPIAATLVNSVSGSYS